MRPTDDVEQLDFEGRSILIHRRRQALLVLNETASLIWQELCAGAGPDDIARDLADSFQIPLARVEHDVRSILSTWQDAGLLRETPGSEAKRSAARDLPPPRPAISRTYALCGRPILVEFGDRALEALLHPLFAPAEVEDAGARDRISLSASGGGYLVTRNGGRAEQRSDIEQALGAAILHVLDLSYPDARWLAIVHAGAVAGHGGALVLPGISGSGKSTLTAALVQAGLGYLSDDIAPLDGRTGRILPVPFALSLKEGSWPVLKHAYPELPRLPVHSDDARRWRYLDLAARKPRGGETLRAIVFPRYQRGGGDLPYRGRSARRARGSGAGALLDLARADGRRGAARAARDPADLPAQLRVPRRRGSHLPRAGSRRRRATVLTAESAPLSDPSQRLGEHLGVGVRSVRRSVIAASMHQGARQTWPTARSP